MIRKIAELPLQIYVNVCGKSNILVLTYTTNSVDLESESEYVNLSGQVCVILYNADSYTAGIWEIFLDYKLSSIWRGCEMEHTSSEKVMLEWTTHIPLQSG